MAPLKKGSSREVIQENIRAMMKEGRHKSDAVASALTEARRHQQMSDGGRVEEDEEDDLRSPLELQVDGQYEPSEGAHPESSVMDNQDGEDESKMFAKALTHMLMENFSRGGLVEGKSDSALGSPPSEEMKSSTQEPMDEMPMKDSLAEQEEPQGSGLSEEAKRALQMRKKSRQYSRASLASKN